MCCYQRDPIKRYTVLNHPVHQIINIKKPSTKG